MYNERLNKNIQDLNEQYMACLKHAFRDYSSQDNYDFIIKALQDIYNSHYSLIMLYSLTDKKDELAECICDILQAQAAQIETIVKQFIAEKRHKLYNTINRKYGYSYNDILIDLNKLQNGNIYIGSYNIFTLPENTDTFTHYTLLDDSIIDRIELLTARCEQNYQQAVNNFNCVTKEFKYHEVTLMKEQLPRNVYITVEVPKNKMSNNKMSNNCKNYRHILCVDATIEHIKEVCDDLLAECNVNSYYNQNQLLQNICKEVGEEFKLKNTHVVVNKTVDFNMTTGSYGLLHNFNHTVKRQLLNNLQKLRAIYYTNVCKMEQIIFNNDNYSIHVGYVSVQSKKYDIYIIRWNGNKPLVVLANDGNKVNMRFKRKIMKNSNFNFVDAYQNVRSYFIQEKINYIRLNPELDKDKIKATYLNFNIITAKRIEDIKDL